MSYDDGSLAFRLRKELRSEFPEEFEDSNVEQLKNGWATYGNYQLVGNGEVTNEYCSKYFGLKACLRTENHKGKIIFDKNGVPFDCSGKAYVRVVHHWCNKPSCPVCFKHGWAVREAGNIEGRLTEASKKFGLVEHIVCSVPVKDYGLSFEALRKKAVKVLFGCGVVGGVLIFHGFRYTSTDIWRNGLLLHSRGWYWNPHFHVLGFVLGGYGRCRHCKGGNCYACGGVEGRCYRAYRENGYIVRVLGERKTVFGTAWYQLNHSTIRVGVKRPHACTWFGVCSYRKLKVTVEKRKQLCPICNENLYKVYNFGYLCIVKDRNASGYVPFLYADVYASDGSPNLVEAVNGGSG